MVPPLLYPVARADRAQEIAMKRTSSLHLVTPVFTTAPPRWRLARPTSWRRWRPFAFLPVVAVTVALLGAALLRTAVPTTVASAPATAPTLHTVSQPMLIEVTIPAR